MSSISISTLNFPLPTHKLIFNKPKNWTGLLICQKIKYYSTILDKNYSIYVDKIYAKQIVNHLTNGQIKTAKIIKILQNINDFIIDDINPNHILKATHASGWNFNFLQSNNPKPDTLLKVQQFLSEHNKIYDNHEKQYKYLKPTFFIEEKINCLYTGKSGKAVVFMFRCIHGEPISIGVKIPILYKTNSLDGNNKTQIRKTEVNLLYDMNWNLIKQPQLIKLFNEKNINIEDLTIPKPQKLDIMLHNAKILSQRFEFVRIDYYIDKNHDIYFSEFTFTPAGGNITFDKEIELDMAKTWI